MTLQNTPLSETFPFHFERMSKRAIKVLHESRRVAYSRTSNIIMPTHLLMAIYFERGSVGSALLKRLGFSDILFNTSPVSGDSPSPPPSSSQSLPVFSDSIKKIILRSYTIAESSHSPYVGTEHLTHAILRSKDTEIESYLRIIEKSSSNVPPPPFGESSFPANTPPFAHFLNLPEFNLLHHPTEQENSSAIDQFCINLGNRVSQEADNPHIGREKELEKLIHILGRKKKNNALLLGEPGVGKTALVSGLMRRILVGSVPNSLKDTTIFELDLASVIAGTSFRGEFEERLKAIIEEADQNPHILLFIDEIHTIIGAGNGGGTLDAANILKPALARGTLRCIGATTLKEFKKHFEKDAALNRRFQTILIEEPSQKETRDILLGTLSSFENFHNVHIKKEALDTAIALSARYIPERSFPDKALDIIDSTCSMKRAEQYSSVTDDPLRLMKQEYSRLLEEKRKLLENEDYASAERLEKKEKKLLLQMRKEKEKRKENEPEISITSEDVERAVAQNTEIPLDIIRSDIPARLHILREHLLKTVIGQKKSILRITKSLTRSGLGFSQSNRPIGSFLLLGPTGVGKTFTAKIIAKYFFPKKSSLIRIDMSEFHERHTLSGLLGAPAGYVGYGEGGTLTEKVRRNPHSLVLFDEVEKAHPDILNILLQILEEGELTDAEGRKVSFSETIIILTANVGSNDLFAPSSLGFDTHTEDAGNQKNFSALRERLLRQLPEHIRPEILARLDDILVLEPLDEPALKKIITLNLQHIKKILEKKKILFSWDKESVNLLTLKSLRKNQGARPLRRLLQSRVENGVTEILLEKTPPFKIRMTIPNKNKKVLSFKVA